MPKGSRGGEKRGNPFNISREDYIKAYNGMANVRDAHMERDDSYSGRLLNNSEFLAHLEDANWHSELRMLREAKVTNEELTYIKDRTRLSPYGVGKELTGRENVEKMIKEAREETKKQRKIDRYVQKANQSDNVADKQYYLHKARRTKLGLK